MILHDVKLNTNIIITFLIQTRIDQSRVRLSHLSIDNIVLSHC